MSCYSSQEVLESLGIGVNLPLSQGISFYFLGLERAGFGFLAGLIIRVFNYRGLSLLGILIANTNR